MTVILPIEVVQQRLTEKHAEQTPAELEAVIADIYPGQIIVIEFKCLLN